ncbi:MAG: hypothetical protein IPM02_24855 [Betaproteobacteria bacterium]|nr:hypothetical protein [Betaproteobacteria bacterium]
MHNAQNSAPFELRRVATCAALATLASLGTFSLIANVMPPLVADTLVLAHNAEPVCVPATQVLHAEDGWRSAI